MNSIPSASRGGGIDRKDRNSEGNMFSFSIASLGGAPAAVPIRCVTCSRGWKLRVDNDGWLNNEGMSRRGRKLLSGLDQSAGFAT